ncbi:N-acetyllactosaminide beta-1,3-N-acetylglucosaminyltransferase 2 [Oncorhynchus tshawytscha]|uniref:Hexosyltransferase n=1 Tax=Oncorhynchus tshawytscha TaxID=74940 RepID=A0AAZ3NQC8_ONCTS|nr:N-acetyllactosaminide beta-1,3-N-acetylglucosaminyltransferase 2 [Oncorhynchus tshawytscha]XP_042159196.1 N-acetyllactosaminide beta-1,3-N-acetylglucosaminyltransferase 2 [Oncorhynchus tshawytscha]
MAQCHCRWRRVLLCLCCASSVLVGSLCVYITLAVCYGMTTSTGLSSSAPILQILPESFIAPGLTRNDYLAPHPTNSFWDPKPHGGALWNRLQLPIDRHYNPILKPKSSKEHNDHLDTNNNNANYLRLSLPTLSAGFSEIGNLTSQMDDFQKLPLQMQMFVYSMHFRDYPVLIEPAKLCGRGLKKGQGPLLLLAIKTQGMNFENRQAIRQTWGWAGWVAGATGKGGVVRRVFLLGKNHVEPHVDISELLQLENRHYGDILQWDFHDSFFNLTLKDVLLWDWLSTHCPLARFVFKGDDDVLLRTPALLDYLREQTIQSGAPGSEGMKGFMVGDVIRAAVPNRVNSTKYFIPDSFYKGLYPPYGGGGGVVYSGELALRLNRISRRVHLYPIDDVYVGMCLHRLGVHPIHHPAFLTFDFPKKEGVEQCAYHTILLVHKRSPAQVMKLWLEIMTNQTECSNTILRMEKEKKNTLLIDPFSVKDNEGQELLTDPWDSSGNSALL